MSFDSGLGFETYWVGHDEDEVLELLGWLSSR